MSNPLKLTVPDGVPFIDFEPCGIQVDGPALGIAASRDQLCLLEDLDVLRDRLLGDREGFGQFIDGGWPPAQPGDEAAPDGIGKRQEGRVQKVVVVAGIHCHFPGFVLVCQYAAVINEFVDQPIGC